MALGTKAWSTARELILRSQDLPPRRIESDHNLPWTEMALHLLMQRTQDKIKAISRRTWLGPSTVIIMGQVDSKIRCSRTPAASVVWWPKAKAWQLDNSSSSKPEDTPQASPSGSRVQEGHRMAPTNRWHKCSIRCNLPHKAISREKVQTLRPIDDTILRI